MLKKSMKYFISLFIPLIVQAAPFIDYGKPAKSNDYPSVVKITQISYHDFFGIQELSSCSGSLLSPKVILTAAHCVNNNSQNHSSVSAAGDEKGKVLVNSKDTGIKVARAYVHPSYAPAKRKYDEAVHLRLTRAFIDMTPAQRVEHEKKIQILAMEMSASDLAIMELSEAQKIQKQDLALIECHQTLRSGTAIEFAGFGRSRVQGSLNSNGAYALLYGENYLSESKNNNLYIANGTRSPHHINGGDSGGPLYVANSVQKIYGISVLRLDGNTASEKKSIFVNLSSTNSKGFFKSLFQSKNVSQDIKEKVKVCAQ